MMQQILDWLAGLVFGSLDGIFTLVTGALLHTPDVTGLPQVAALTGRSIWIVDSIFVLAFIAAGITTMTGGASAQTRYHIKDLAPRFVVGFAAAHFSTLICREAIVLANALVGTVTLDKGDPATATNTIRTYILAAGKEPGSSSLLVLILAVIVMILLASCAFAMIVRMAILLVLAAVAPIALAGHALPATDGLARMWWRAFAGCLAIPVLQAFTLQAGMWMLTDSAHLFPMLGLPGGVLINLFVVMVLLWTTVKIPGMVRKYVFKTPAGGTTVIGGLIKYAAMHPVAKAAPMLGHAIQKVRT